MKLKWERNLARERPGQAHVFAPSEGGALRSVCGVATYSADWGPAGPGRLCAICRKRLDPENAPKAPSWRMPE